MPGQPLETHDQVPCGLLRISRDGAILWANSDFARLVEREPASLVGIRFQDLLTRGGAIFYETQFAPSLLLRGSLEEIAFELAGREERVPVFANARHVQADGAQPEAIVLAVFVARQRRLYEKELLRARRESEEIAEVVRRSSDAILRLSAEGIIESCNNGAQQIFGYQEAEMLGQPLRLLFAAESVAEIENAYAFLKRGLEQNMEMSAQHKDGGRLDVSVSMTPHMEAPGTLVGFSAILRDTTRRVQAERALLQTEKLASVGRLASSIAHEINNPLESVTNLLYILRFKVVDEEAKALVKLAEEELARVSQIATYALRFHKQTSGRTEVNLEKLVDSVLGLYRGRLVNAGVEVVNDSRECPPLLCYENELRQILLNLVANALDAMRSGGRLRISCRGRRYGTPQSRAVRIAVSDNGSGMDTATLARLFEPFFSTKGIGGTGLGLWISKDLITRNGGLIRVRSRQEPGRSGTTFVMWFPLDPVEETV